jgi:hypothetical protein
MLGTSVQSAAKNTNALLLPLSQTGVECVFNASINQEKQLRSLVEHCLFDIDSKKDYRSPMKNGPNIVAKMPPAAANKMLFVV